MQFTKTDKKEMPAIYAAMQENFVSDELRDYESALAVLDDERYGVYRITEDGSEVGFICLWSLGEVTFVEHFVIYSDYRGKGVGGRAIDFVCEKFGKVILEVEKPEDEIKRRRIAFYERHGFTVNPQPYSQPAYRSDSERVPMRLMSFPCALEDFDGTVKRLYDAVYHVEYSASGGAV